jgi:hypothetical protein
MLRPLIQRKFARQLHSIDAFLSQQPIRKTIIIRLLPVGSNVVTNLLAGTTLVSPLHISNNLSRFTQPFFTTVWPLLAVALLLIFTGIGLRDPWPADEPKFALIAKEIVETGQWFFPARGQELHPDKPPYSWLGSCCLAFNFYWRQKQPKLMPWFVLGSLSVLWIASLLFGRRQIQLVCHGMVFYGDWGNY